MEGTQVIAALREATLDAWRTTGSMVKRVEVGADAFEALLVHLGRFAQTVPGPGLKLFLTAGDMVVIPHASLSQHARIHTVSGDVCTTGAIFESATAS